MGIHIPLNFKKRGLPHCHALFITSPDDSPKTAEKIDQKVCAEIPDPNEEPELYEIVKSCMIHGPCGNLNPRCICMDQGKCQRNFPKDFCDETNPNVDGYPLYRRRNNGRTIQIGQHELDNRWVVPYNKALSLKYNAHINFEICSTVKSVKYIYKYIYKGHDCASVKISEETGHADQMNWNEIDSFLETDISLLQKHFGEYTNTECNNSLILCIGFLFICLQTKRFISKKSMKSRH